MKKINYNNFIKIKLTEFGKIVLYNAYKGEISVDENGFAKMQMWDFIGLFGQYIQKNVSILEDGYIYMDENRLVDV